MGICSEGGVYTIDEYIDCVNYEMRNVNGGTMSYIDLLNILTSELFLNKLIKYQIVSVVDGCTTVRQMI